MILPNNLPELVLVEVRLLLCWLEGPFGALLEILGPRTSESRNFPEGCQILLEITSNSDTASKGTVILSGKPFKSLIRGRNM